MQPSKLIGLILITSYIFLSWYADNPKNAHTGAPRIGGGNEPTCAACHTPPSNQPMAGDISISGLPSNINANASYPITVTLTKTAGDPVSAGFQLVALNSALEDAGTITVTGANTGTDFANSRTYIEHRPAQPFSGNTVIYTFDWQAPSAPNNDIITLYAAGNIADGDESEDGDLIITTSQSGTLIVGDPLTIDITSSSDISCNGINDGSATSVASGGSGNYTYLWSNGETNAVAVNLPAGLAGVTVSDGANSASDNVMILAPPPLNPIITNPTFITCIMAFGSATVTTTGGTPGYSYEWDNDETNATATNLSAGQHTVTVTDNNNCTESTIVFIESFTESPNIDFDSDLSVCEGESIVLSPIVSGGAPPYSYLWSNGTTSSTIGITPSSTTTYCLTITDANGCTSSNCTTVTINSPPLVELEITPASMGMSDGMITANTTGGTPSYAYLWNTMNLTTATITDLSPGTYSVTVTDATGCTAFATGTVNESNCDENPIQIISIEKTDPTDCGAIDGTINIVVTAGTGSYEYSIDNGLTWQTSGLFTGLSGGDYLIQVRNSDGTCAVDGGTIALSDPPLPVITATNSSNPTDCNAIDGTISIVVTAGTGSYEYTINNGLTWQTSGLFTGLSGGDYVIQVRNSDGTCAVDGGTITIADSQYPMGIAASVVHPTNCDASDGSITILIAAETGTYEHSIDDGLTWHTSGLFTGLSEGDYFVKVRNSNGTCTIDFRTITLLSSQSPMITTATSTDPTDCSADDGTISIVAEEGSGTYEYTIDNGLTWQTSGLFTGLTEGDYVIQVRNSDGTCATDGGTITLSDPPLPVITATNSSNPTDCDTSDGTISILVPIETESYEFSINNGFTWQISRLFTGLSGGDYVIQVRNSDGTCAVDGGTITLSDPQLPFITATNSSNPTVCGADDGTISIVAEGGTGSYEYTIDNGLTWQTSGLFTGLSGGDYVIQVRNSDGTCAQIGETVILIEPAPVTIEFNDVAFCEGECIVLTVNDPQLTYEWSTGQIGFDITICEPGDYCVTVTNDFGCSSSSCFTATEIATPSVNTFITNASASDQADGSISVSPADGVSIYSYQWSDLSGNNLGQTADLTDLAAGDYTLEVADMNGCYFSDTLTVDVMVGINQRALEADITISPNPASSELYIDIENANFQKAVLEVINLQGQLMKRIQTNDSKTRFDVTTYPAGLYFVKIEIEGKVVVQKVVIGRKQ